MESVEQQMQQIFQGCNILPAKINSITPKEVATLIKNCFNQTPNRKPTVTVILDFYKKTAMKTKSQINVKIEMLKIGQNQNQHFCDYVNIKRN